MSLVGGFLLAGLVGAVLLGMILALTWLTFPTAAVVRSATRQDPSRWVRQALGRGVSIRDLGEVHEATARLGHVELIVSWDDHSTRLEVEAPRAAPAGATLDTLRRLGTVERASPLRWSADRPPDAQLRRVITAVQSGWQQTGQREGDTRSG